MTEKQRGRKAIYNATIPRARCPAWLLDHLSAEAAERCEHVSTIIRERLIESVRRSEARPQ
jgi:hypothetical protein